jgi:hypothetical protein
VSEDETEELPRARARRVIVTAASWPVVARIALWVALALPAVLQLGLLVSAIHGRFGYPYDLEWMEGGMLHHAQRIRDGVGLYVPPSIDFIPYLYTPLYPSLLALLGGAFGVSYAVGRAISILALVGIAITAFVHLTGRHHEHPRRGPVWAGVVLALGLFAAAYPITDGWYDLVRADTLFLLLVTAGIGALPRWASMGARLAGHAQVAAGAALLALAFFCKQTGFAYVALGGVIVLVIAWRRVPVYVATAGILGLGGSWLLDRASNDWYWTYVSEIHRAHDFNMDRFWKSFGNILWQTKGSGYEHPVLGAPITIVVVGALILVGVTWWKKRVLPPQVKPLLLWSSAFATSVIIGAIGWGTEFAHFNAYMPAFLHGALAAGCAVPAAYACTRLLWGQRDRAELVAIGASVGAALPLAIVCITARWEPQRFVPTSADVTAGDRLIERLRAIEGEVWMPSHPWYVYMAGKTPRVHRMGIKDVTTRQTRTVEGLEETLRAHGFAAIVLDNADLHNRERLPALLRHYRPALKLPAVEGPCPRDWICRLVNRLPQDERPRVYSGAKIVPNEIWVPAVRAAPPPGAKVLFDFEAQDWTGWQISGAAWGKGPVQTALPGQDIVIGATGTRFATSMHGGNASTGRVTSPAFVLEAKVTLRLGGGTDATKLRVELWLEDKPEDPTQTRRDKLIETASVPLSGGSTLRTVTIAVPPALHGKFGKLVLVDDSPTDHLSVDDIWSWTSD